MRASALLGLNRDRDARKQIAIAEQSAPKMAHPATLVFLAALLANRMDIAGEMLDRLIANFPDDAREIDRDLIFYFFRNEPDEMKDRNDDRRIALARLGFNGDTATAHYFAANAVGILVKRGDFAGAASLLDRVREPVPIENMLVQKRFAPLWPKLEEIAGPHLAKIRAASAAAAAATFRSDPTDPEKLQLYVNALRTAGRYRDAVALKSQIPSTPTEMAGADENLGWAVNNIALAMHSAGQADQADQLFALLNDAKIQNGEWRVSMKINRLELLVTDGRFDKARPLIQPTEDFGERRG